jgi:hypothetical protein
MYASRGASTQNDGDKTSLEIGIHNIVWETCKLMLLRVVQWSTNMQYIMVMQTIAISRMG